MPERLLDDICRCLDEDCKDKDVCLRYLDRPSSGWISYAKSLRNGCIICDMKISASEKQAKRLEDQAAYWAKQREGDE